MRRVSFVVVRPIMLGIMVGVTRRTVFVGIPQVQFSDLVVVPVVQRQASGPDSAAPCVLTTSVDGWSASQADQFEGVRCPLEGRSERLLLLLGGEYCRCVIFSVPWEKCRKCSSAVRGRRCAHTATSSRHFREVPQLPSSTSS